MKKQILEGKGCRGSFTIEAALLMTIIIPVLTGLIYLGIYQHDKVWLSNKAGVAAIEMAVDDQKTDSGKWGGRIGNENISGGVFRQKGKVQARIKGDFQVPGLVLRFFAGGRLKLDCSVEKPVTEAKKEIQKLRNLQQLKKGGAE